MKSMLKIFKIFKKRNQYVKIAKELIVISKVTKETFVTYKMLKLMRIMNNNYSYLSCKKCNMYFNRLSNAVAALNDRLADEAIDDYINEIIKCMYNEDNLLSRKKIYNDYILNGDPKFYKHKDKKIVDLMKSHQIIACAVALIVR